MCNTAELKIAEYHNIRVLTTQQLAGCYGTTTDTITKNFNRNKDRYIERKHYIALEGDNKNDFLNQGQFDRGLKNAKTLYLWTEKGAFLHAKSLNTDEAWDVYDRLVESYFRVKQRAIDRSQLSPQMQMFYAIADEQAKMELEQKRQARQIERVEEKQRVLSETFENPSDKEDFKSWCKKCIKKIADTPKFCREHYVNTRYHDAWNESYARLSEKRACRLGQRVKTAREKAEKNGASQSKIREITYLSIITDDKDLKPVYETVIKEMMLAYCVA
ncbi:ORF6N domain-containing protein [Butyribacter intestini]|uniref:KilA-N DNA-binding domain-containing protein n=1 Tax=Butyribacter intestini TaxID=1703332 RepID=A0AAW3JTZ1_9FIRM|nr:ORF6N domain-containing protein [Butyribacter intestini]KQC86029.1 hypothetical protein APZ18_02210 [Butyribacter intestini]RHU77133.1 ORF6N domain-containing protein [Butyribacter intestini]